MSTLVKKSASAQCNACAYWQAKAQTTTGECRRHAPQTIAFNVDAGVKFESRFPLTKAADWCGDYAKVAAR